MADIDFEELDKAVSSLMSQHNSSKVDTKQDDDAQGSTSPAGEVATNTNPAFLSRSEVQDDLNRSKQSDDTSSQASASPLVARRQSGRFMDVFHPSSDMRTAEAAPSAARQELAPNRTSARQSASLQPLSDIEPEPSRQEVSRDAGVDVTGSADEDALNASLDELSSEMSDIQPMESPFLADVEVDKRPLGGTEHLSEPDDLPVENSVEELDSDTSKQVGDSLRTGNLSEQGFADDPWSHEEQQESVSVENFTPPELSPEMMALESTEVNSQASQESSPIDTVGDNTTTTMPDPIDMVESVSGEVGQELDIAQDKSMPVEPVKDTTEAVLDGGVDNNIVGVDSKLPSQPPTTSQFVSAGDIVQQYKPTDTEAPEPSDIFAAASEAPQPLAHPEKKKSGWNIVVWLIISLLVGVLGGVVLWYFLVR